MRQGCSAQVEACIISISNFELTQFVNRFEPISNPKKMRVLTGLIFIINVILWLFGIVLGFIYDFILGFIPLIGFIAFLIAYSLSEGFIVSVSDYFFFPSWDVFKRKIKWANGIGLITSLVVLLIIFLLVGI